MPSSRHLLPEIGDESFGMPSIFGVFRHNCREAVEKSSVHDMRFFDKRRRHVGL